MPRWIWIALLGYSVVMGAARTISLRELPFEEALAARDFSNVFIAGKMVLNGSVDAIYDLNAYAQQSWKWIGTSWGNNYSYPPHSLFLAAPFGLATLPIAFLTWNLVSLILYTIAARPYLPAGLPWWVVTFSPATIVCLIFGHYGLLIGALWLWAFRGSGTAAGILTIKPHLGLLIFIRSVFERRMFLSAGLFAALLIGSSMLVFGLPLWSDYLTATTGLQLDIARRGAAGINMVSPFAAFGLLPHIAFALAAMYLLWRRFDVFTAATATFLIVPYAMHYDMTVVCLGVAALLAVGWHRLALWERTVLLLAFLVPVLVRGSNMVAPPLLLAALYLQVRHGALLDPLLPKAARPPWRLLGRAGERQEAV